MSTAAELKPYLEQLEQEVQLSICAEILANPAKRERRVWVEVLDSSAFLFRFVLAKLDDSFGDGYPQLDRGLVAQWLRRRIPAMRALLMREVEDFKTERRLIALKHLDRLEDVCLMAEKPVAERIRIS